MTNTNASPLQLPFVARPVPHARWLATGLLCACLATAGCRTPMAKTAKSVGRAEPEMGAEEIDAAQTLDGYLKVMERAAALQQSGETDAAMKAFQKAAKLAPSRHEPWRKLGVLFDQQERYSESHQAYRSALKRSPRQPGVLNDYGYSLWLAGNVEQSVQVLEHAAKLAPDSPRVNNNLAMVLGMSGDMKRARELFLKHNAKPDAYYNLGSVALACGDEQAAREAFDQALALAPMHSQSLTALMTLDKTAAKERQKEPSSHRLVSYIEEETPSKTPRASGTAESPNSAAPIVNAPAASKIPDARSGTARRALFRAARQ